MSTVFKEPLQKSDEALAVIVSIGPDGEIGIISSVYFHVGYAQKACILIVIVNLSGFFSASTNIVFVVSRL